MNGQSHTRSKELISVKKRTVNKGNVGLGTIFLSCVDLASEFGVSWYVW